MEYAEQNIKLTVTYDGTNYFGWQTQTGFTTIQEVLETVLERMYAKRIVLRYSSRTDSGVHALDQTASFVGTDRFAPSQLQIAINSQLPPDIVIKNVEFVDSKFDARRPLKKTYLYQIYNSSTRSPFLLNRAWWVKFPLDLKKLERALNFFEGTKDFTSFMASDCQIKTTVRTIESAKLDVSDNMISIRLTANGFLKQMVRNIVGTCVDISRGKCEVEDLPRIINARDRTQAGKTAPAYALYLEKVYYE